MLRKGERCAQGPQEAHGEAHGAMRRAPPAGGMAQGTGKGGIMRESAAQFGNPAGGATSRIGDGQTGQCTDMGNDISCRRCARPPARVVLPRARGRARQRVRSRVRACACASLPPREVIPERARERRRGGRGPHPLRMLIFTSRSPKKIAQKIGILSGVPLFQSRRGVDLAPRRPQNPLISARNGPFHSEREYFGQESHFIVSVRETLTIPQESRGVEE